MIGECLAILLTGIMAGAFIGLLLCDAIEDRFEDHNV